MTRSTDPESDALDDRLLLARGQEAAEDLDPDRVRGEAVAEGLTVLLGQQGGRHQDRDLHALLDRLERGPDGDLGLAEADVAADQPVHGGRRLHVRLHRLDGGELVRRLPVGEGGLELVLPGRVEPEDRARAGDALLVEDDQLLGDLRDRRAHPGLRLLPVRPVEPAQGRAVPTGVVTDHVDLVRRDVEPVAAAVLQDQVVPVVAGDGAADHAAVAGHAVLVVDDVVALFEVVEEAPGVALAWAGGTVGPAPAGDVPLGEDGQLRPREDEPSLQGGDRGEARAGRGQRVIAGGVATDEDVVLGEDLDHAVGAAVTIGRDHQPVVVGQEALQLLGQHRPVADDRVPRRRLDLGRRRALGHGRERPDRGVGVGQQAVEVEVELWEGPVPGLPGLGQRGGQVGLVRQQVGRPVSHAGGLDQEHEGVVREQVGQQALLPRQPRQPRLHPVEGLALGEAVPLLPTPRLGRQEGSGPLPDVLGGQQLPAGEEMHLGSLGGRALIGHRELAQAVDLVAPQVDAHRLVGGGREHVDDGAPHGDLAPVLDLVLPAVTEVDQLADQTLLVDLRAGADDHGGDVLDVRAEALDQGPDGGDHDSGGLVGVGQVPDRPQAAPHGLHRRTDPLEGQGLPRREHVDAVLAAEDPQVVGQAFGFGAGRCGHHDRVAAGDLGQAGDEDGPGRLRDGQGRRGRAEDVGQDGLVPQQRGERAEGHRPNLGPPRRRAAGRASRHSRALTRSIARSTPSAKITSTASAASCTAISSSRLSRLPGRART